jgi:colanic acid/amylovoran biosynthesis glycosyltransferase
MAPFLRKGDYDLIHCHFGPNGNQGILLKDLGVFTGKIITVFHGYDISQYIQKQGTEVYDRLIKRGDLFLPIMMPIVLAARI